MTIQVITKGNSEISVFGEEKTVFIDFGASRCGHCMLLSPVIEEISKEITVR